MDEETRDDIVGAKQSQKIPLDDIRRSFEKVVTNTTKLTPTPLGVMTINGVFTHYMDPDTDTMFIGFLLGMRCLERIVRHNGRDFLDNTVDDLLRMTE